ncbi:MAG: diaminopimelate epimerase [Armatimonadia bacterium]|nr:diaminopimelate epimerase [Armatimonadia bacterium]
MTFHKLHGLGNDFVVVDALDDPEVARDAEEAAPGLCDRTFGIGSDGVLIAVPSDAADFEMIMVNPDGTRGMCGNGLRCFARFLRHTGRTTADAITIDTPGGVTTARLLASERPDAGEVEVDMGRPLLGRASIPMRVGPGQDPAAHVIDETLMVGDQAFPVTCVSMGNPHCVIFVEDPSAMDLAHLGPAIEHHEEFPERTNVHLVQVIADDELSLRVWERGAGLTLACGTGACAATVAGAVSGRSGRQAVVHMPGGDLRIHWKPEGNVLMRGPAVTAFVGEIELDRLPRL